MIVSITLIKLRSPFQFFRLSLHGLHIYKQLENSACLSKQNTGFWKTHYTMTAWKSKSDIDAFYKNGAHLDAMKETQTLAEELRFIVYESDTLPSWKEAKEKVMKEGRVIKT